MKPALLVIDIQHGIWDDPEFPRDSEKSEIQLASIGDILKYAIDRNLLIIILECKPKDKDYGDSLQIIKDLAQTPNIFTKSCGDAFEEINFDNYLREQSIDSLVLMGINASYCVKKTAESAIKKGYCVVTSPDLISDDLTVEQEHRLQTQDFYLNSTIFLPTANELKKYLEDNIIN